MQGLYILLGALLLVILGLFIYAMFLPNLVKVERSRTIPSSQEQLFEKINDLKSWPSWSPWFALDPGMLTKFSEISHGAGAHYTWESKNQHVGKGSVTILESKPYTLIITQVKFVGRRESKSMFRLEAMEGNQVKTRVTWTLESNLGQNPVSRIFGRMMDKFVGPDFEKGLQRLEEVTTS
ncbi:hypothetical protein COR50_13705 [Chitinophaga caeni]|uniref:Polyketide cyclase n=1 Tax=Chitinophaga caeni TaxID=2029983 RepID=A0A291QW73_9BACT|nr:SRPBCC family protein [Chitinophaga caeni]ATL48132.1 hypothetical protein COR50_13705 [Chitinophaga caeni]